SWTTPSQVSLLPLRECSRCGVEADSLARARSARAALLKVLIGAKLFGSRVSVPGGSLPDGVDLTQLGLCFAVEDTDVLGGVTFELQEKWVIPVIEQALAEVKCSAMSAIEAHLTSELHAAIVEFGPTTTVKGHWLERLECFPLLGAEYQGKTVA